MSGSQPPLPGGRIGGRRRVTAPPRPVEPSGWSLLAAAAGGALAWLAIGPGYPAYLLAAALLALAFVQGRRVELRLESDLVEESQVEPPPPPRPPYPVQDHLIEMMELPGETFYGWARTTSARAGR